MLTLDELMACLGCIGQWLAITLLLGLAELTLSAMVLLALAVTTLPTAFAVALGLDMSGQIFAMGIFSGVLVPLGVMVIRPRFSPREVAYGNTGSGVQKGQHYRVESRDFDGASVIKVNPDLYRIKVVDSGETLLPPGTPRYA